MSSKTKSCISDSCVIMDVVRKNLFLYLTLICFLGLLAIFVIDGYMGLYDTLYVTAGEQTWTIGPDYWVGQRSPEPAYSISANWDERVFFRYNIDNRRLSQYSTDIEVSIWHSQEKLGTLLSQSVSVHTFGKVDLEWTLYTTDYKPADQLPTQTYDYTIIVKLGNIERRAILYVNPLVYPIKPTVMQ